LPEKCPKLDGGGRCKYSNAAWKNTPGSSVCSRRDEDGANSLPSQGALGRLSQACAEQEVYSISQLKRIKIKTYWCHGQVSQNCLIFVPAPFRDTSYIF